MVECRKLKQAEVEQARSLLITHATNARDQLIILMQDGHREYDKMDKEFETYKQCLKAADALAGWNTVEKDKG